MSYNNQPPQKPIIAMDYSDHLIDNSANIKEALLRLNQLDLDMILFVVDKKRKLLGSLTDGDVRRGLLNNKSLDSNVLEFIKTCPKKLQKGNYNIEDLIKYRKENYKIIPIVDDQDKVIDIINFRIIRSYLPLDALIMAGGKGTRLKPLTDRLPKPLIPVGEKPIIDYNIDHLLYYGIKNIKISVNYLGDKIEKHIRKNNKEIEFIWEDKFLGTIGSAGLVKDFVHDAVLIMNSDLLTNIDFETFFLKFKHSNADMAVAAVPYEVYIPYAVMELQDSNVRGFTEKPIYQYYTNGGIYIVKKETLRKHVQSGSFYNATDLMKDIMKSGGQIYSYPMDEYWLDIGKHQDLEKANNEIHKIKFQKH